MFEYFFFTVLYLYICIYYTEFRSKSFLFINIQYALGGLHWNSFLNVIREDYGDWKKIAENTEEWTSICSMAKWS